MNQDQEFTPLTKGSVFVGGREKLVFPVAQPIQVHITDGRFAYVDREIDDAENPGQKKRIQQAKVLYTFHVDSDVKDAEGNSLKGKTFSKSLTLSDHDRATYPKLITAVNGSYSKDPFDAVDKPLQVMFSAEAEFEGRKYQPVTYLPPAAGQEVPLMDSDTPTDEELNSALDEIFNPDKSA